MDIDKGNYSQLDGGYDDIHTIGSLLKKFLKDLPDPLIPSNLYLDFINAACIPSERERMRMLKDLVFNLPPVHYHKLKFLLTHLHKVSEYSEANKVGVAWLPSRGSHMIPPPSSSSRLPFADEH